MTIGRIPSVEGGIQPTIFDAKADLLTATAADTPARLAVGTNGQVLQADSTTSTGLKWATLSAGAYTSLASGNLSNNTVTLSSISQDYTDLYLLVNNPVASLGDYLEFRINGSTGTYYCTNVNTSSAVNIDGLRDAFRPADYQIVGTTQNNIMVWLLLRNYAAANRKTIESGAAQTTRVTYGFGYSDINAAITSISIKLNDAGRTFSAGTYTLYGVK